MEPTGGQLLALESRPKTDRKTLVPRPTSSVLQVRPLREEKKKLTRLWRGAMGPS